MLGAANRVKCCKIESASTTIHTPARADMLADVLISADVLMITFHLFPLHSLLLIEFAQSTGSKLLDKRMLCCNQTVLKN